MDIKPRTLLSAPANRPWAMGHYLKDALERLGVPVTLFDFRDVENVKARLVEQLDRYKPELHILFKGERFDRECIRMVRAAGVPTVLWHHDVFPNFPRWLLEVAGAVDFLFTHARGMVYHFRKAGLKQVDWLSEGFPESHFRYDGIREEERKRFTCQVTLVGNVHMNRRYRLRAKMIQQALEMGCTVKWWGPRISRKLKNFALLLSQVGRAWGGAFVANADFAKAVACSDIFLARDEYPEVDASVSNRLYWACGSGAFYLTYATEGMEDIMEPGKEIETFRRPEEMEEKIHYYLEHPEKRRRIAEAGRRRTLEQYTFRHRMEEMLERLAELKLL